MIIWPLPSLMLLLMSVKAAYLTEREKCDSIAAERKHTCGL